LGVVGQSPHGPQMVTWLVPAWRARRSVRRQRVLERDFHVVAGELRQALAVRADGTDGEVERGRVEQQALGLAGAGAGPADGVRSSTGGSVADQLAPRSQVPGAQLGALDGLSVGFTVGARDPAQRHGVDTGARRQAGRAYVDRERMLWLAGAD